MVVPDKPQVEWTCSDGNAVCRHRQDRDHKGFFRALGVQCYVFNCSDQMDYKAMGQIYKGLAQTGA